MNIEDFRNYCLAKKGVTEDMPFGEDTLVFKVKGKMFALTGLLSFSSINLKCETENIPELRAQYPAVQPGFHMNKNHWITVLMDNSLPDKLIKEWIDTSYRLVIKNLPKKIQNELE